MPLVQKSEFYEDWLRPLDIDDGLFVRLTGDQLPRCLLVAAPRRSQLDTPERVKFMSALVIHLQHALRTGQELGALATHSADLAYALDVMPRGVAIVGPGYCVTTVNSAAEVILRAEDGLRVRSGQLAATSACTEHKLYRALYVALTGGGSNARTGQSFTCERPSGKRPYVIHVMPLHSGRAEQERAPSALVLFVDSDQEPEPAEPLLRRLYGITRSEAEVALHMMRGADVKQISDELCISAATVRTHLQHIFDKTDTHRQTDLVRLLLSLSL
jgi:DNA-binding CsgD family transcriptional regulator/PAS domain-containing protein